MNDNTIANSTIYRTKTYSFNIILLVFLLCMQQSLLMAQNPGSPDVTFGGTGKVLLGIGYSSDLANVSAVQPDGKILIGGLTDFDNNQALSLMRIHADGSVDTSFNHTGKLYWTYATSYSSTQSIRDIKLQSDGKIVVVGVSGNFSGIARFNSNGTVDATFSTDGRLEWSYASANSLEIQPDGKILIGGGTTDFTVGRLNTDGTVDNTFNTTGVKTIAIGTANDYGKSIALQQDGKIIIAGHYTSGSYTSMALVRLNANASIDSTFGTNGIFTSTIDTRNHNVNVVKIQSDGKIVVAGDYYKVASSRYCPFILRLISNGSYDTSFGINGVRIFDYGTAISINTMQILNNDQFLMGGYNSASNTSLIRINSNGLADNTFGPNGRIAITTLMGNHISVQSNQKIIFAGYSTVSNNNDFCVTRLNTDGSADLTFGTAGILTRNFSYTDFEGHSLLLNGDSILFVGASSGDFSLTKILSNGTIDTSFGNAGSVYRGNIFWSNSAYGKTVLKNNKIVHTNGEMANAMSLWKMNIDGTMDNSFGSNGNLSFMVNTGKSTSCAIQNDNKILTGGYSGTSNYNFALLRHSPTGVADNTFGSGGQVITNISATNDAVFAVETQPDGKIICGGLTTVGSYDNFIVLRHLSDGSLDTSFNHTGYSIFKMGTATANDIIYSLAMQQDGKIVAAGKTGSDVAVARLNTDGALDTTFNHSGKWTLTTGYGGAKRVLVQPNGKIVLAVSDLFDIRVIRLNSNGSLDASFGGGNISVDFGSGNSTKNTDIALQADGKILVSGNTDGGYYDKLAIARLWGDSVPTIPEIINHPGSKQKCFGSNTSFSVLSLGQEPLTYHWYHNGIAVQNNNYALLNLTNINYADSGNYYCIVSNSFGSDTSNMAHLTVNPLPQVDLGNDTTLCSDATINLNAGNVGSYFNWNNGLHTRVITADTAGMYSVIVVNPFGCSASDNINISKYTPVNISMSSVNTVCNQSSGVAVATVTGGTPPYTYLWNHGDTTSIASSLAAGVYMVYVRDSNQCKDFGMSAISTSNGPVISNVQVTPVSCFGGSNGAISLSISGTIQPHFEWSNGDTLHQNISNLTAGPYEITVTSLTGCQAVKSILVTQLAQLNVSIISTNASCGNADGNLHANVSGGSAPYNYQWSNGNSTANIQMLTANTYLLTVTDSHMCTETLTGIISETGAAIVSIDSVINPKCNSNDGAIYISVSGGVNFTYLWSNGATTQNIFNVGAGNYSVTISSGGCNAVAYGQLVSAKPLLQPICIVSVDHSLPIPRNMLVWEKQQTAGIAFYKIWKETTQANVYQVVATVPYAAMSKWTDPNSNPHQRAWRYKISAVDSCGMESPHGQVHKTIHLTVSLGQNQDMNLIWSHYEGFNYYTYYIYRYRPFNGWRLHDSIPGNLYTYTDTVTGGIVRYKVLAKKDVDCWSSGISKDMGGPFSQSLSNIEDNGIIEVGNHGILPDQMDCRIYPNPTSENISVVVIKSGKGEIIDADGRIIQTINLQSGTNQIDLKNYRSGIYNLRFITSSNVIVKKLIIQ